jgi:hypothetical protein
MQSNIREGTILNNNVKIYSALFCCALIAGMGMLSGEHKRAPLSTVQQKPPSCISCSLEKREIA